MAKRKNGICQSHRTRLIGVSIPTAKDPFTVSSKGTARKRERVVQISLGKDICFCRKACNAYANSSFLARVPGTQLDDPHESFRPGVPNSLPKKMTWSFGVSWEYWGKLQAALSFKLELIQCRLGWSEGFFITPLIPYSMGHWNSSKLNPLWG